MASLAELARAHTTLEPDDIEHLQRLVGAWAPLADLTFADLLLHVPVDAMAERFVTVAHVRSTTGPTVHVGDPVGLTLETTNRPTLARSWLDDRRRQGLEVPPGFWGPVGDDDVVEEDVRLPGPRRRFVVDYIPVRFRDRVVAVLTREAEPALIRHRSGLETTYATLFERLADMVHAGVYPYESVDRLGELREPRVGDGVMAVDREGRIDYASPNAVSALRRLGVINVLAGQRLRDLGLDDRVVRDAVAGRRSTVAELEGAHEVSVVARCYPLLAEGSMSGVMLLLRDISELRHRDRLLVSKDTTIREIHHRVKNNLQTIGALLRLQARRLDSVEAKAAIEQSVRRIASIAMVHETLALETTDTVEFGQVVRPLLGLVEEGLGDSEHPVRVAISGTIGAVSGEVAMPLAVVLTELVQNAIDHGGAGSGSVRVVLGETAHRLDVTVADTGPGVPEGFSLDRDAGLGLTIVRSFVVHDLGGSITIRRGSTGAALGTIVAVSVPRERAEATLG